MTVRPSAAAARPGWAEVVAAACLEEARRAGAAAADVYVKESLCREAALPEGTTGESSERGAAVRVFLADGRSALAASTLPPPDRPAEEHAPALARRAVEAAALASPAPRLDLPAEWSADGRGLGLFDPEADDAVDLLLERAREIHTHAAEVAAGSAVRVRLQALSSSVHLRNTAGFSGSYRQTLARAELMLAASGGRGPSATRVVRAARSLRGLGADAAAAEAVALLEERQAARLPPSGIHPVLLAPRAASELLGACAAWLAGGGSFSTREPALRRGERIASAAVTLMDDGRLPGGVASAPFDGEGTRTRRTIIVERGIVRHLLRDLESGAGGDGSTGNGVRASFREAPSLRPTNLFVKPGAAPPADLLASLRQGIRISALGRIAPLAGPEAPFAVPFTGRWIESGRLGAPLAGGFLAGTIREILGEVEEAASDLSFHHRAGSFGSPSLLLRRAPIRSS